MRLRVRCAPSTPKSRHASTQVTDPQPSVPAVLARQHRDQSVGSGHRRARNRRGRPTRAPISGGQPKSGAGRYAPAPDRCSVAGSATWVYRTGRIDGVTTPLDGHGGYVHWKFTSYPDRRPEPALVPPPVDPVPADQVM